MKTDNAESIVLWRVPFILLMMGLISACSSITQQVSTSGGYSPTGAKSIFVFMDGTANDSSSATNIWLAKSVIDRSATSAKSLYLEGVGSARNPLPGMLLGWGMEPRINFAYQFIADNYEVGDKIYIFGFSRGAHQARALAGLVAYAGLPSRSGVYASDAPKQINKIIESVKERSDADFEEGWRSGRYDRIAPMAASIRQELGLEMNKVDIEFLGLWDTVPGSSFKEYGVCKENADGREGERYKTGSYPNIKKLVHAVSADEKRSKFRPILLCTAMSPQTAVIERLFPGAHADVGGGYEDSSALAHISLRWMLGQLESSFPTDRSLWPADGRPGDLAHWSKGDFPANVGSECEDRKTVGIERDASIADRKTLGAVPLHIKGRIERHPYPVNCPGPG